MTIDLTRPPSLPRPAAWMFVTATAKARHHFRPGRNRSTCGRYFRNAAFTEAGLWWPEADDDRDDCLTCRQRLAVDELRHGVPA